MSQAYFVISDITGYTSFLTQSELDHAQDILKTLFDTLLSEIQAPLIISNFQGDAILTYAPLEAVTHGESLLEQIESIYLAFTHRLDLMQHKTTCQCKACANMKSLDLKLFVHFGEYVLQDMRGKAELSGPDVIIAHRMMKNGVKEQTGLDAYALFSKAAIEQLGLQDFTCEMVPHSETYEHIGEVSMYAYCLKTMWEKRRDERRVKVSPEETWFEFEGTIDAPRSFVWECLLRPDLRATTSNLDGVRYTEKFNGRVVIGSSFHCAHGSTESHHRIMDLEPLRYYTEHSTGMPLDFEGLSTTDIEDEGNQTRIIVRHTKLVTRHPVFRFVAPLIANMMKPWLTKEFAKVGERIQKEYEMRSQQSQQVIREPVS